VPLTNFDGIGSWYKTNDFLGKHCDYIYNVGAQRRVAMVLHLARGWQAQWGGNLVWTTPLATVVPAYNVVTLFAVSDGGSFHYVEPVMPGAPWWAKRLAVAGWWLSWDDSEEATRLSHRKLVSPGQEFIIEVCIVCVCVCVIRPDNGQIVTDL
jgi:Rps23 Pro-64 3,4-dihydroxylase Tpa1-like proline 4-hydroxylase